MCKSRMDVCTRVVAREFWFQGKLVSPCCCLFVCFESGNSLVASYNDELCTWELNESHEAVDFSSPEGDEEFFYPYRYYLDGPIKYKGSEAGENTMVVYFSGKVSIELSYCKEAETEEIKVNT
jgi:hypothetical protein